MTRRCRRSPYNRSGNLEDNLLEREPERVGCSDGCYRHGNVDILAAVKRTAIPHHATFLGWSLNGVDASPKNA
ncbi:MAG: hypothetical protein GPJ07_15745 [Microcystis aeruginosa G13-07]|nr:hypothetical protein [Microcystis aeruginosa G13-07]